MLFKFDYLNNLMHLSKIILLMSLLTSLSSSSFFLVGYLTTLITDNNYNDKQFSYALKHNNVAALIVAESKTRPGSDNWFDLNRKLAKTQSLSALRLANWHQALVEKQHEQAENLTAIMWFEQAIRLHSAKAVIGLAQLYFDQGKAVKARNTLSLFANQSTNDRLNEARLILAIKLAIYLGDIVLVEQLVNSEIIKRYTSDRTDNLVADIAKYSIITDRIASDSNVAERQVGVSTIKKQRSQLLASSPRCISSLQLFATNLAHLKHLDKIIETFKSQQQLAQYICLPTPKYISTKLLDCSSGSQQAITCDESAWLNIVEQVDTRHIGLMLAKGGANVHLGMMYFDVEDDVNVFSHEISHLLGFVDEYPLIKNHNKCRGVQQSAFAHNIVVLNDYYQGNKQKLRKKILADVPWASQIKSSTPILQRVHADLFDQDARKRRSGKHSSNKVQFNKQPLWRLGTPIAYKDQVGLYISESCEKAISSNLLSPSYAAYKPVARRTQLRYYASDFPQEYLLMLTNKPEDFLMPSFHYNIALAFYQQGKVEQAKSLLIQAQLWEKTPKRKASVFNGHF